MQAATAAARYASDDQSTTYSSDARLQLADEEIYKVELMYSSRSSQPFVCPCLANLYEYGKGDNWNLLTTGIPLLVVESSTATSPAGLYIRLAELGTGFTLWKQPVSSFTRYCAVDSSFHTFFINTATGSSRTVGISFDHSPSARKFYQQLRLLQADTSRRSRGGPLEVRNLPADQFARSFAFNGVGGGQATINGSSSTSTTAAVPALPGRIRRTKTTGAPPSKSSISGPCCFKHITCLRPADLMSSYDAFTSSMMMPRHVEVGGGGRGGSTATATLRRTTDRGSRSFTNLYEPRNFLYE